MAARVRWRPALAAVLGAVAVAAGVTGGVQALGGEPGLARPAPSRTAGPPPTGGSVLPGRSDPDAIVPPAGAVARPPAFAPSAVVPVPLPQSGPEPSARPSSRASSAPPQPRAPSPRPDGGRARPGHAPTSGESQYEYGCRRGYITVGC